MPHGCWIRVMGACCLGLWISGAALAQPPRGRAREAVLISTEPEALRRLETARQHLKAGQWEEAIPLLRQAADQHGETWVRVEEGRYLPVQTCCDMLLASLPKEALAEYRKRIDPQARRWFEQAAPQRDELLLSRLVRQSFVSSHGDDALWLLGELAFEKGLLSRARSCWSRLLPQPPRPMAEGWPVAAAFPDSSLDPSQVRARLVLCSIMESQFSRAQQELDEFSERHSDANGTLAGRKGVLREILAATLEDARQAEQPPENSETGMFGGNSERNKMLPRTYDLGGRLWSVDLRPFPVSREDDDFPFELDPALPTYFPAVVGNIVVLCDEFSVYVLDLYAGAPAFPTEEPLEADADDAGLSSALVQSRIYKLPPELRPRPGAAEVVGVPVFSPTVDRGRVYVRLGSVSRRHDVDSRRSPRGFLVCLDLAREGKHVATIDSEGLSLDGGGWTFEGPPVVGSDRVCISLRRHKPQPQLAVACYDSALQRLLWVRQVCLGSSAPAGDAVEISHQMLTLAGDRVFFNTNVGAVAALALADGSPLWMTTYEHADVSVDDLSELSRRGPNPCVFHGETVYVSPLDSPHVLALEADTGRIRWKQSTQEDAILFGRRTRKPVCLLGIAGEKLVAAGEALWTLDLASGRPHMIGHNDPDPALHVWGRGLLAAETIYTTSRDTLFVRDTHGRTDQLPVPSPAAVSPLVPHGCTSGGNLTLAKGVLLVAQRDRLTAIGELATLRKRRADEVATDNRNPRLQLELGLIEEAQGLSGNARGRFRETQRLSDARTSWEGLPLKALVARHEQALLIRAGDRLRAASKPGEAAAEYLQAAALATSPRDRVVALQLASAAWTEAGKPESAIEAWQQILDDPACHQIRTRVGPMAASLARTQIAGLIRFKGRPVYSAVEKRAQPRFQSAIAARDLNLLDRLLEQYPLSAASGIAQATLAEAWLERGEAALSLQSARRGLRETAGSPERARLLVVAARAAEQLNRWATARGLWTQLSQSFPRTQVADGASQRSAAEFVPARLSSTQFQQREPQPSPVVRRIWTVHWDGSSTPVLPAGTPADTDSACLLLVGPRLVALDQASGRQRWSLPLNTPVTWAAFLSDWLVAGSASSVFAVDPASGRVVWEQTPASRLHSFRTDGERIYCRSDRGEFLALAAVDGRKLWEQEPRGQGQPHWQAAFGCVLTQTLRPPAVVLLNAADGSRLTVQPGPAEPWLADPCPIGPNAFAVLTGPQELQMLEAHSGSVRWSDRIPGRPAFAPYAAVPSGDGLLLFRDGTTVGLRSARDGHNEWPINPRLAWQPVRNVGTATCVDGQCLYIVAAGILRCLDLATGKLLWEQRLGDSTVPWQVDRLGPCLIAWPTSPGIRPSIALFDPRTGDLVQRLALPSSNALNIQNDHRTLVVAAGNELTAMAAVR